MAQTLRQEGHDVLRVPEVNARMPDSQVLELASQQGRILITSDKDFGELVFLRGRPAPGILLLRLSSGDPKEVAKAAVSVVRDTGNRLEGQFAVVTDNRVRLRRMGPA